MNVIIAFFLVAPLITVYAAPQYGLPSNNKQQAFVLGSGIISFTDGITNQTKEDIKYALLYAQIMADNQFNRHKDLISWYKFYAYRLINFGFDVKDFNFEQFKPSSGSFVISDIVEQILEYVATTEEFAVTEAAMNALRRYSESDERIQLFDLASSNGSPLIDFSIYSCGQASTGEIVLVLAAFRLTVSRYHSDYLFYSYRSSSVYLSHAVQIARFKPESYATQRDSIRRALEGYIEQLVREIDL